MKEILLFVIAVLVVCWFSMPIHAQQDFRCGGYIVKTGDSKVDVLIKCGEPMMKEEAEAKP